MKLHHFNTGSHNELCVCVFVPSHLDSSGGPALTLGGYFCPQCQAKYTELPVECKVCGMCDAGIHCVWNVL